MTAHEEVKISEIPELIKGRCLHREPRGLMCFTDFSQMLEGQPKVMVKNGNISNNYMVGIHRVNRFSL